MVTYPGLCKVLNHALAPLALNPRDKRPYFGILQHISALAYRKFNTFNKKLAGDDTNEYQRHPIKIEPHVSVTAKVSSSHSTTGNAGELMIKGQLAPYPSVLHGQYSKVRDDKGLLLGKRKHFVILIS